jgi:hypothetical protein
MCGCEDENEHGHKDVGCREISQGPLIWVCDIALSGLRGVHDVPDNHCDTRSTVRSSIMKDFGEAAAGPQWHTVGARDCDLVHQIYKVLLSEQKCDHKIDQGRAPNTRCQRTAVSCNHKYNECI